MRLIAKLIIIIGANALALWATANYISGFKLEGGVREIVAVAVILTALNFFLKPILKLLLGPIIILTLGLGLILVNAAVLYILDLISENIMIDGTLSRLYATMVISVINFIVHLATKK